MYVILLCFLCLSECFSLKVQNKNEILSSQSALNYLIKYGYMKNSITKSSSLLSIETLKNSIKEFQGFSGLEMTGELNEETLAFMALPRCGVKDTTSQKRHKRYVIQGSRWRQKEVSYRVTKYPSHSSLSHREIDALINKSFSLWSDVSSLTFKKKTKGAVDIEFRWERMNHGDEDPFDGPSGTLAHAFYPLYGGDVHFDDDEMWTSNSKQGTNLIQTAVHEIGHSLGLSHSNSLTALMAPFYRGYDSTIALEKDDVEAIQSLYGKKVQRNVPSFSKNNDSPSSSAEYNSLCDDFTHLDTIVSTADGSTYVFIGDFYWNLVENSVVDLTPRFISEDWKGLPSHLDASLSWKNGKTYFFKGDQYWRFVNKNMDTGYPKELSSGFRGIPSNVDSAFVWSGNGKIYFTKGNRYWRFDPLSSPPVPPNYPKPLSNWEGLPSSIHGALKYSNGYTYFFKDDLYWRFQDEHFKVDYSIPKFPRKTKLYWFGCSN